MVKKELFGIIYHALADTFQTQQLTPLVAELVRVVTELESLATNKK